MAKQKTDSKTKAQAEAQLAEYPVMTVNLKEVVSNYGQTRGMGVVPNLNALGYPMFEKSKGMDGEPLWAMLTGDDDAARAQAASLIAENEPSVVELWTMIKDYGQLQAAGVYKDSNGNYNVVWGMRRAIACALGFALGEGPLLFQARLLPNDLTQLEYETLGGVENNERSDESPIDKAMTWQRWKKDEKLLPKDIAARIGKSEQHVLDHLKLLDKRLEPFRIMIHNREMPISKALDKLKEMTGQRNTVEQNGDGPQRPRFPAWKRVEKILGGYRPAEMKDKEWALWVDPKVREFLGQILNVKIKPLTQEQIEGKVKEKKAEKKDEANGTPGAQVNVGRKLANDLLIVLGKTNAATWTDAKVKEALENIVSIAEPEQKVEGGGKLQQVLDTLLAGYPKGLTVNVKPLAKAAAEK